MSLQFLFGASGTGKTTYIFQQMIEKSQKEDSAPVIFMLPEQANMTAEKEMIHIHPNGGTMDISILSFTRLAFKIFDELNIHTKDVLDDFGKSMFVMRLMKEHEKELSYYGSMVGKQGFIDEVKSILSEFYQYQITDSLLEQTISKLNPDQSLYHKLSDLRILFRAFEEAIHNSYMVTEQYLTLLKEVLSESTMLKNAEVYFDGFTGFTPAQFCIIEELLKLNCNLYISMTMDEELFGNNAYSKQGLFALSKQTVDSLCKLAKDCNVVVLPHVSFQNPYRMEGSKELQHLERQLFRFPTKAYNNKAEDIVFLTAKNMREECDFVARKIQNYVKEKQYHYNDFAIVSGNVGAQKEIWKETMERHNVPYFLDFSESMDHNPLAEIVRKIREVLQSNYRYESVFGLLKTGFFDMEWNAIYELENYAKKYGVRGYSWWNHSFHGNQKGLHEINKIRACFMEKMFPLMEAFQQKNNTAKNYILAIYNFMLTNEIPQKIHEKSICFEKENRIQESKAYEQVYTKFLEVLDKMMDIFGEEIIARDVFLEVLQTGISDMRLGVIPSTMDQVIIGDTQRTRLSHIKVLFVVGINEGIFPTNDSRKGLLGDRDRELLKDMQIVLAPNSKEEMYLQQLYFYLQITKASEKIFFSYQEQGMTGEILRPSYYWKRLCGIFPNNPVETVEMDEEMSLTTEDGIVNLFAKYLADIDKKYTDDSSIISIMQRQYPNIYNRLLDGFFYNNENSVLLQSIARKLYGTHMIHSVSRLESYSGCAYQFFLQYGLKLRKPEVYSIETNNIGTILHGVMEHFFTWVRDEKIDLHNVSKEVLNDKVEQLTIDAAHEENETIFDSSHRNRHMLDVFIRIAKRCVDNLCRHLREGDMQPAYFEEKFSPDKKLNYINMALKDGVLMEMSGIVDRVDLKETEDAVYFKVIDYKSGSKDIDYIKMLEGRQLQLTVYMSVMEELLKREYPGKKIIPTGMYYFHLQDPFIEEEKEEKLEDARIGVSRLSGLVNSDEDSLMLMDQKTGTVTPVKYKKDGTFSATNRSLVSQEELGQISQFVREKMIEIGNEIVAGKIPMNPEKGEQSSPCNLCDYRSVCRFEVGLGGNAYKIAPQISTDEAKKIILKKEEDNQHEMDERSTENN